jgi:hypothetical protein
MNAHARAGVVLHAEHARKVTVTERDDGILIFLQRFADVRPFCRLRGVGRLGRRETRCDPGSERDDDREQAPRQCHPSLLTRDLRFGPIFIPAFLSEPGDHSIVPMEKRTNGGGFTPRAIVSSPNTWVGLGRYCARPVNGAGIYGGLGNDVNTKELDRFDRIHGISGGCAVL